MRFLIAFCALLLAPTSATDTDLNKPFSASLAKLDHAPCITLYYRYGRVGCGTEDRSIQVGQLQYFDGSLPQTKEPYVAVMEDYMLTAQSLDTLLAARGGLLQGVLVVNSTASDGSSNSKDHSFYSPDAQAPQGYGTPSQYLQYGNYYYQWNSKGQNLFSYDLFGLPMALVVDSEVSESLRQESQSSSADSSIVAEFNYYMGADNIDSKKCLAWEDAATGEWAPKCLPLGGTSVWATGGSPPNPSSDGGSPRNVIMVAASMDSTSMFHDVAPGANTAASNILTLLMVAKLLGENINDNIMDNLSNRILLGFFQGESYGFLGSRSFLKDLAYPGFQCYGSLVRAVYRLGDKSDYACLNPVRPSLQFANLGKVTGMISVDQVGHDVGDGILYVHADANNDSFGSFLASTLMYSKTTDFSVAKASSGDNNGNGYPYPPTPLTSLLKLSGGAVGGAVLTGYDNYFSSQAPYHSHMDSAALHSINMDSIAASATIIARAALAAAYDSGDYDYQTAANYAKNLIPELSSDNADLNELSDCLFYNGDCKLIKKYSSVEMANERAVTGLSLGAGAGLGTPPSYYVGVYSGYYGQPFVQVGDNWYGAYDGQDYGKKDSDAIGMTPSQLESTIHGLLNDYLGRGTISENSPAVKCSKQADCGQVEYCASYGERATCTGGGVCVCSRAHYHVALDEALKPAPDMPAGYFKIKDSDSGNSPIYTEPFWSNDVGVHVYRDVGWLPGFFTLVSGLVAGGVSLFAAFVLKVGLKKEKLY